MKQSRLRVSIVIPAYNEEHHLRACLEAIATQTVRPFEVIVVDNNSTDRTAALANEFSFVKVVSEPRQGRVFARSRGFDEAAGDIIGRIDADIILPAHWVEHLQRFYSNTQHARTAWSGAGYFYNVRLPRLVSFGYGLMAFRFNKLLVGHYSLWGSNMALPRALWQAVRLDVCWRNDIHEDLDLAIHIAATGGTIHYDTVMKTNAELRRVHAGERQLLWHYLQWWPRTLRVHRHPAWPVCWFFGVLLLYIATYILLAADKLAPKPESITLLSPDQQS